MLTLTGCGTTQAANNPSSSTSDLEARIAKLEQRVAALEKAINGNGFVGSGLTNRVSALEDYVNNQQFQQSLKNKYAFLAAPYLISIPFFNLRPIMIT